MKGGWKKFVGGAKMKGEVGVARKKLQEGKK